MANRIGFSGVPTGSQFEITAGDRARGTGAGGWGVAQAQGTPRATIRLKRSFLQVAPEGMMFEVELENFDTPGPVAATGNYDPRFHEIYYVWDFGDPGKTFTKPEHILPEHRDANRAYGPLASHTYTAPGTYTVTLDVIEPASGKTAQATLDVTVNDPDGLFAGSQTLYVDPDGDFTNAPVGAQTFSDIDTAMGVVASGSVSDTHYYRVMLARDKTHDWLSTKIYRSGVKTIYMCAEPGAGALPIVRPYMTIGTTARGIIADETARNNAGKITDFRFTDLDLRSYWDSTIEAQSHGDDSVSFLYHSNFRGASYCLFNNVKADGFFTFWADQSLNSPTENQTVNVMNDCEITNWANFAVYADLPGNFAFTGTKLIQDVSALSGGPKSLFDGKRHNEHGPVRLQGSKETVFDACDVFSRTGWYENSPGIHTVQPGIRFAQSTNASLAKLNMQRCCVESSGPALRLCRQDLFQQSFPINMLVEKNYLVSGAFTPYTLEVRHGGLTLRNNVIVKAKTDDANLIGISGIFRTVGTVMFACYTDDINGGPEARACPQKAYNNTFVAKQTVSETGSFPPVYHAPTGGDFVEFDTLVVENNLDHLPNQAAGAPHAIDQTVLFTARYDGYRSFKHPVSGTLAADVGQGQSFTIPYGNFGGGVTGAGNFDLAQTDGHKVNKLNISGVLNYVKNSGAIDTRFTMTTDATGVVVTNNTSDTWPAGATFRAAPCRSSIYFRPEYGNPPDTIIAATLPPDSSALGAATSGPVAYDDMRGNPRPALPALGAYELE